MKGRSYCQTLPKVYVNSTIALPDIAGFYSVFCLKQSLERLNPLPDVAGYGYSLLNLKNNLLPDLARISHKKFSVISDIFDALSDALDKSVSSKVLSRLQQIIQLLYTSESLTLANLMGSLSVSRATMQRDMLYLNSIDLITTQGSDKYREYLLNDALRNKIDVLK